jgi:uncharacterized protein YerC
MTAPAIFDDIRLGWQGKPFVIPAHRVMGALARVEDVVTLSELQAFAARKTAPMAKLAMAYGSALRYAGATATDEEVYRSLVRGNEDGVGVLTAVAGLLSMMIPPVREVEVKKDAPAGNVAADASSRRRSRRR